MDTACSVIAAGLFALILFFLTLPVPIPDEEKGLKGLRKTFWGITKKCEKNLA